MKKNRVEFTGSLGEKLTGLLELPDGEVRMYALFAHCFTCGKDIIAASRIARALTTRGIAVMRFDFTGLGSSDGDFANTNFSSNVEDLVLAADYLRDNWRAPDILIGHSLGGTAVLKAAGSIPESRGVVTIGAPAEAEHVIKQFAYDVDVITTEGQAQVSLAGRPFTIRKQFLDDVSSQGMDHISTLSKALLVMHSPVDATVSINQAEKIYRAAKHPKGFISLDTADHLLSNRDDAEYVATVISAWAGRFASGTNLVSQENSSIPRGQVLVSERKGFTQDVTTDEHHWPADEPLSVGGSNLGPDPYEHLLAALGTCTSMTIRMYANRRKWPLSSVDVQVKHYREHGDDCTRCDEEHSQVDIINRRITLKGNLDEEQRNRLMEIADRCPVHRTLHGKLEIETQLI
ncbi:MAG: putative OsmC-like protein/alpha/beta superfamily hydrolase [Parasphingorhabdus sp.]|jgi:uncharacterized OsmC-like protein/alpha/beta superfamily hydrolase